MTFLKKILLVDYEPTVMAVVRQALEGTGKYMIREERDRRQVLNAARWFQPDLILFDVPLDHPDGEAVVQQFRTVSSFESTPLVYLSVDPKSGGGVVAGGMVGGYSFSATTVPMEELVNYIGELVSPARC